MSVQYRREILVRLQVGELLERQGFHWTQAPERMRPIELVARREDEIVAMCVLDAALVIEHPPGFTLDHDALTEGAIQMGARPAIACVTSGNVCILDVIENLVRLEGKLESLEHFYPYQS